MIFREGAEPSIKALSEALDGKTLESYGRMPAYAPPQCLTTYGIETNLPSLYFESKRDGYVNVDQQYLEGIWKLFLNQRDVLLDELIGSDEDWRIYTDINERSALSKKINHAIKNIKNNSPYYDEIFDSMVKEVVPLKQPRARGLSLDIYRGSVFLGAPVSYPEILLELDIVHEVGHQVLSVLNSCDPVIDGDYNTPVYSEIRHTERPAIQSLHATFAIAFMLKYLVDIDRPEQLHPDCPDLLSTTLQRAVDALWGSCDFTSVGESVLEDFYFLATSTGTSAVR